MRNSRAIPYNSNRQKIGAEMTTSTEGVVTLVAKDHECLMDTKCSDPVVRKHVLTAFTEKFISKEIADNIECGITAAEVKRAIRSTSWSIAPGWAPCGAI